MIPLRLPLLVLASFAAASSLLHATPDVYVDAPDDFQITSDQGAAGLDSGDTVTWNGINSGQVSGLVFGTDAFSSIQSAVNNADSGGTVHIAQGTYLEGSEISITKSLTIIGEGANNTAISGNSNGDGTSDPGEHRVFSIASGSHNVSFQNLAIINGQTPFLQNGTGILNNSSGTVSISNSTLSGNSAESGTGGGIYNSSGTLSISDNTFSDNSADFGGGGIFNNSGTVFISNSTLSSNSADVGGGGVYNNSGTLSIISNSTLSGNSAESGDGGGIYNKSGTLSISNSTLSGNSADTGAGGGLFNSFGTGSISNSTLSGNSADFGGGGIFNDSGTTSISDSTLSDNTANNNGGGVANFSSGILSISNSTLSGNSAKLDNGGGIFNFSGTLSISNSTLSGNFADLECGGGIFNDSGTLSISDSTLSGNSAAEAGGGILNDSGTLTISNSTLSDNSANFNGGGGIDNDSGTVSISNSTLSDNSAADSGGGISNFLGTLSISNSTLSRNTAAGSDGGGIWNRSDTFSISNSTLSDNSAADSGGGISNFGSSTLSISNSLVVGNTAPTDPEIRGTLTDNGGNLLSIPGGLTLNDILLPLGNNGGPTQTHALPPGSPAINMGDNDNIPLDSQDADNDSNTSEVAPFDQRGSGFNRVLGDSVDIGAFEVQNTPPVITLSGDNPVDLECGSSFTDVDPGATAMDAQDGDLSGSIVVDSSAVDANTLGTYTVTFNVMDSQGAAAAEVTRTVHVVDTTAPTLTIPADVTVESTSPEGQEVNIGTATATDACDADPTITNNAPTLFVPGTTIVTWTATDDEGNASTATQTVIVEDDTAPATLSYGEWREDPDLFVPGTPDEDMEAAADPDNDALTNLEEFFHGLLPLASSDAPLDGALVLENGDFFYEIAFPRRRGVTGVAYRAEAGVSLRTWKTASPVSETIMELDAQRDMVCLRFQAIESVNIEDIKRQFFQIVVEVVE